MNQRVLFCSVCGAELFYALPTAMQPPKSLSCCAVSVYWDMEDGCVEMCRTKVNLHFVEPLDECRLKGIIKTGELCEIQVIDLLRYLMQKEETEIWQY